MAWDKVATGVIASWAAALLLHQAVRVYHYGAYLRANPSPAESVRWGRLYIGAAVIAGLIWGGVSSTCPTGSSADLSRADPVRVGVAHDPVDLDLRAGVLPLLVLVLTPFIIRCLPPATSTRSLRFRSGSRS
jgi:hypothetical protein